MRCSQALVPRPVRQRLERAPRERVGEQRRRRAARSSARARAPPSAARRARADRPSATPRRRSGRSRARRRRAGATARACDRVAQPVGIDVEPARELHDVLVAHEVVRMLGDQRRRVLRGTCARPSSDDDRRRAQQPVEPELEERRRALHRGDERFRIVAPHVGRDRDPAGRSATWNCTSNRCSHW